MSLGKAIYHQGHQEHQEIQGLVREKRAYRSTGAHVHDVGPILKGFLVFLVSLVVIKRVSA